MEFSIWRNPWPVHIRKYVPSFILVSVTGSASSLKGHVTLTANAQEMCSRDTVAISASSHIMTFD